METEECEDPVGFWPMIVLLYDVDTLDGEWQGIRE